jgi:CheY-like chemotaxis protein
MVYGTVKNHGGAVVIESVLRKGTTVTMLFPMFYKSDMDSPSGHERRTPSDMQMATILLIDDEEMIRKAGKRLLRKLGYRVLTAQDGKEGLRTFAEKKDEISIIMLDLIMPVMDGEETLTKIRDIDEEIPVLLSSGYSKEEKAERLMKQGADDFIQKPFDMTTLKQKLSALLKM